MKNLRLGVLVSGRGSNLQALIDACEKKEIPANVAVVISNVASAFALERAKKHRIPDCHLQAEAGWGERAVEILKKYAVDWVCLAGFMKRVPPDLLRAFPQKILNIHPSLLPAFPGLNAQGQALEHGVKVTGVSVHFVDVAIDSGPILLQTPVPVLETDTVETLSERILKEEHKLYPEAIRLVATQDLKIAGRRVISSSKL